MGGIHFWFLILANTAQTACFFFFPLRHTCVFFPKKLYLDRSSHCWNGLWLHCLFVRLQSQEWIWCLAASEAMLRCALDFASAHSGETEEESVRHFASKNEGSFVCCCCCCCFFFKWNPLKFTALIWVSTLGSFFHCFLVQVPPKKPNAEANSADKPSFFRIRIADLIYRTKDGHLDA